ncbi:pilus assembly protein TadB [Geodermatophilus sp. TF02-6]|uniref:type II secretion system F family protein n=1 Tax=Geodermatophilus sp. TF02-6 TaxID=2250575 RepID=UPI000DE9C057|nr:type II secretion system F family protein [Geodermatophilus sp. TF02-6]RBY74654.1 pilus assembly protein TadB [Geodermatophilus sp. TF02-6]
MTAALLLLAAALLLWPGDRGVRRARWQGVRSAPAGAGRRTRPWAGSPSPGVCAAAAAALVAGVSTPLVAALAGAGAALAARADLRRRAGAREQARLAALVEALVALAAELRSGRTLEEAARAAAAACADDDSARALTRAVRAPEAWTDGVEDDPGEVGRALRRVSAASLLSVRTGCSLVAVVGAVEDDLRARHRRRLDLRSATAGARASAGLLAGLPVLGLVMGGGVGADPWGVLTTTVPGQVLLVAGVGLEVAGVAWSARLVRRAER